jgi:hypothetical protein
MPASVELWTAGNVTEALSSASKLGKILTAPGSSPLRTVSDESK